MLFQIPCFDCFPFNGSALFVATADSSRIAFRKVGLAPFFAFLAMVVNKPLFQRRDIDVEVRY